MLGDLPVILEPELPDSKNLVCGLRGRWGRRWRRELLNPLVGVWLRRPSRFLPIRDSVVREISRSHLSSVIKWKGREGNDP